MDLSITVPVIGSVAALLFAAFLFFSVKKQSAGNKKMQELSSAIREGAMAFLNSEYKVLVIFVIVITALLFGVSYIPGSDMYRELAVAFIVGAIFSAVCGNIGLRTATMANARAAEGTKKSLSKGLSIAFSSGAVMGMCVVGLGVLGVFGLYYLFVLVP